MAEIADLETIRRALQAGEFFLVYQPIVALDDRRCVGAEALIRWRRGGTLVTDAADFIPQTDQTPLSGTITYWVMDTVANELGGWLGDNRDAMIGINVPPEILGRGGIEYAANKSGLRAHAKQLVFEITERGVPDQLGSGSPEQHPDNGRSRSARRHDLVRRQFGAADTLSFRFCENRPHARQPIERRRQTPAVARWSGGAARHDAVAGNRRRHRTKKQLPRRGSRARLAQGHLFAPPLPADELVRFYAIERAAPRERGRRLIRSPTSALNAYTESDSHVLSKRDRLHSGLG